jgi:cell division protein FtsQ
MKLGWLKKLSKPRSRNRARPERTVRQMPVLNFSRWIPVFAGTVVTVLAIGAVATALDRHIHKISAVGAFRRASVLEVEQVVRTTLYGGFVRANISDVQNAIEALPWVDNARVQRRWPDGLLVQITEQEAVARWGDSGLVNARGELFVRDERHVPMELPRLAGPEGTERHVADLFFQVRTQLDAAALPVTGLRLDARGAWEIELANGVVVRLGRREVQERLERFLTFGVTLVTSRSNEIAYIDMRYSNGFSVGWRGSQSQAG